MEHCRVPRAGIDVFIELAVSARGKWLCSGIQLRGEISSAHITLQCAQNFDLHSKHRNVVKRDEELWYEMLVMHTSLDSVHLVHVTCVDFIDPSGEYYIAAVEPLRGATDVWRLCSTCRTLPMLLCCKVNMKMGPYTPRVADAKAATLQAKTNAIGPC